METSKPKTNQNTGVMIEVRPKDYIAGFESGVGYEERLPSGNWIDYRSRDEAQYREGVFDTLSCVTFATLNDIETQINFLYETGKIPQDKVNLLQALGYFGSDNRINLNDAFTAQVSGTTKFGNYLQNPAESVRLYGVLPQGDYLQLEDCQSLDEWLDGTKITQSMKEKAKKFLEIFDFSWEWINVGNDGMQNDYVKHLKHSPLTIASGVCSGWSVENPVKKCGLDSGHSTALMGAKPSISFIIADHYKPFVKELEWDYLIKWAIKTVVTVKKPSSPQTPIKYHWNRVLSKGMSGEDVRMLQRVLMAEVPSVFNIKTPTTYFGDRTFAGVIALQEKYASVILAPIGLHKGTGKVAGMTLAFLNKQYA